MCRDIPESVCARFHDNGTHDDEVRSKEEEMFIQSSFFNKAEPSVDPPLAVALEVSRKPSCCMSVGSQRV